MGTEPRGAPGKLWARGVDGRGIELRRLSDVVDLVAESLRLPPGPAWRELALRLLSAEVHFYVEGGAGRWWAPLPTVEPTLTRHLRCLPSSGPDYLQESRELPELPELRGLAGAREVLAWIVAGGPQQSRPRGLSSGSLQWLASLAVRGSDALALFPHCVPAEPSAGAAQPVASVVAIDGAVRGKRAPAPPPAPADAGQAAQARPAAGGPPINLPPERWKDTRGRWTDELLDRVSHLNTRAGGGHSMSRLAAALDVKRASIEEALKRQSVRRDRERSAAPPRAAA